MPKIDVVLTPDGRIGVYVQDGSFAEAKAAVEALLAQLGAVMPLTEVTAVEQHRHRPTEVRQQHREPGGQRHEP